MSLQAVLFDKRYNNTQQARRWLAKNNVAPIKQVHTTNQYHRYRVTPPVGQMRTMTLNPRRGIKAVVITSNVRRGGSLHMPHWRAAQRLARRRGGAIGSDLAVGAATVGIPLAIFAMKKLYDRFKS